MSLMNGTDVEEAVFSPSTLKIPTFISLEVGETPVVVPAYMGWPSGSIADGDKGVLVDMVADVRVPLSCGPTLASGPVAVTPCCSSDLISLIAC